MEIVVSFIFAAYVVVSVIICVIVGAVSKSNKAVAISVALCVLVPFYDVVPTRLIANKYCQIEPKSKIDKIVEYPKSVYVEINSSDKDEIIYNGRLCGEFDEAMLDGIHVEKMAVNCYGEIIQKEFDTNSSDYKQYINLISQYQNLTDKISRYKFYNENIRDIRRKIIKREIIKNDDNIVKDYNYLIVINQKDEISKNSFENTFFHLNDIYVIDNKSKEKIAFWKMYIRNREATFIFPEILMPHFADDYQFTNKVCGKIQEIEKVFDMDKWGFDFSSLFNYCIYRW